MRGWCAGAQESQGSEELQTNSKEVLVHVKPLRIGILALWTLGSAPPAESGDGWNSQFFWQP